MYLGSSHFLYTANHYYLEEVLEEYELFKFLFNLLRDSI